MKIVLNLLILLTYNRRATIGLPEPSSSSNWQRRVASNDDDYWPQIK